MRIPKRSAKFEAGAKQTAKAAQSKGRGGESEELDQLVSAFPEILPVLPSKDLVAYPSVMISMIVARPASIKAIEYALKSDKIIFVVAQKQDRENEEVRPSDLYKIGIIANVVRTLKQPDGQFRILVQGICRGKVQSYKNSFGFLTSKVEALPSSENVVLSKSDEALIKRVRDNLNALVEYQVFSEEFYLVLEDIEDPGMLADIILAHYKLELDFAQKALEQVDSIARLKLVDQLIAEDFKKFLVGEKIKKQTQDALEKGQREYFLREQLTQIKHELGEKEDVTEELSDLKAALEKAQLPKAVQLEAKRQFQRLERMTSEMSEYILIRTYLDWIAELPWEKRTVDRLDLKIAQKILDEDHFGLEKIKERILEYLSVRKLNRNAKGQILCLVGPPGVGKTSLGRSISKALKRSFVRMSLGGVRDEAEIRGHRRTYVGSLPGKIVQCIKQAGTKNPVFVLDELDKVGADFRGDPASALLEVLDPQQNKEFSDHYLGVPFDLSEVLFIATANTTDTIPDALLDRLEVIHIPGYTTEEKLSICKKYLVPRQIKEHGLAKLNISFTDSALLLVVEGYTREAGVRNLEREVANLCRKIARDYDLTHSKKYAVNPDLVKKYLGPTKFEPDTTKLEDAVGVCNGLAWTVYGGEIMTIEASSASGKGGLSLTGQLGDVMQESAKAAFFYARANAKQLGLDPNFAEKFDFHVHLPEGATPKDGPSAGVGLVSALVSVLTNRKIRKDLAMTGEVTLRGRVLAVGGIKEKCLAALRQGIKNIIIPHDNLKDLEEIPKEQRKKINFIPVSDIREVLQRALK